MRDTRRFVYLITSLHRIGRKMLIALIFYAHLVQQPVSFLLTFFHRVLPLFMIRLIVYYPEGPVKLLKKHYSEKHVIECH